MLLAAVGSNETPHPDHVCLVWLCCWGAGGGGPGTGPVTANGNSREVDVVGLITHYEGRILNLHLWLMLPLCHSAFTFLVPASVLFLFWRGISKVSHWGNVASCKHNAPLYGSVTSCKLLFCAFACCFFLFPFVFLFLFLFLVILPPDSKAGFHMSCSSDSYSSACWRAHWGNQRGIKPSQRSGQREPHVFLTALNWHTHTHSSLDRVQITARRNCSRTRAEKLRFWTGVVW